jgi:hypothetical protein
MTDNDVDLKLDLLAPTDLMVRLACSRLSSGSLADVAVSEIRAPTLAGLAARDSVFLLARCADGPVLRAFVFTLATGSDYGLRSVRRRRHVERVAACVRAFGAA